MYNISGCFYHYRQLALLRHTHTHTPPPPHHPQASQPHRGSWISILDGPRAAEGEELLRAGRRLLIWDHSRRDHGTDSCRPWLHAQDTREYSRPISESDVMFWRCCVLISWNGRGGSLYGTIETQFLFCALVTVLMWESGVGRHDILAPSTLRTYCDTVWAHCYVVVFKKSLDGALT